MALALKNPPTTAIPIRVGSQDILYVGDTRVMLETVISAFQNGATPEEIGYQYPSLTLADIYAVIGYYLHHQDEVDVHLHQQRQRSAAVKQQNEARFSPEGIRARLLARSV